jgi:GTPase Era involved in 16S rRNA processing
MVKLDNQTGITIRHKGAALKQVRTAAHADLEKFVREEVQIKL